MKSSSLACVAAVGLLLVTSPALADEPSAPEAPMQPEIEAEEPVESAPFVRIDEPAEEIPQRIIVVQAEPDLEPVEYEAPKKTRKKNKHVRSVPLTVVGSVLTGVGSVGLATGAALYVRGSEPCNPGWFGCLGNAIDQAMGVTMMVVGGLQIASGVPMLAVGARRPAKEASDEPAPAMSVEVSATGASFTMEF